MADPAQIPLPATLAALIASRCRSDRAACEEDR